MEATQEQLTQSSNFSNGENNEIRIFSMSPIEENNRKLYEASKMGSIQRLKTLIGDDPNIIERVVISSSNDIIESPLHVSILHGHLEFTRFLLNLKPELAGEVDALQQTPLHLASANGEIEIVQALLEKNTCTCMVRDLNGLIPLHHGVINGQIEIVQELINARPQSIWMKLPNGQTILHLCVKNNHLEPLKSLIITILNIHNDEEFLNIADDNENTILDLSMMFRRVEIVRYLLSIPGIKIEKTTTVNNCVASNEKGSIEEQCYEGSPTSSPTPKKLMASSWKKHLKYKGDWLQEVQGTMMLVATVIATVTFQGAINPPGGVWQEDIPFNSTINNHRWFHKNNNVKTFIAGTAVMAYPTNDQGFAYTGYLITNSISFFASICVIMFIIGRLPLKNRICAWLLTVTMCLAIASLSYSYLLGVQIVNGSYINYNALRVTYIISFFVFLAMVGVVALNLLFYNSLPYFGGEASHLGSK